MFYCTMARDGAKAMSRLMEHHLNPTLPQQLALHLHAARLVCLQKPGGGHRPTVVESAWLNCLTWSYWTRCKTSCLNRCRTQFGIGVPSRAVALIQTTETHRRCGCVRSLSFCQCLLQPKTFSSPAMVGKRRWKGLTGVHTPPLSRALVRGAGRYLPCPPTRRNGTPQPCGLGSGQPNSVSGHPPSHTSHSGKCGCFTESIMEKREELFHRLRGRSNQDPASLIRDMHHAPAPFSVKIAFKRLTRAIANSERKSFGTVRGQVAKPFWMTRDVMQIGVLME